MDKWQTFIAQAFIRVFYSIGMTNSLCQILVSYRLLWTKLIHVSWMCCERLLTTQFTNDVSLYEFAVKNTTSTNSTTTFTILANRNRFNVRGTTKAESNDSAKFNVNWVSSLFITSVMSTTSIGTICHLN